MQEQSGAQGPRPVLESGDFSPASESSRSAGPEADVDSAIEVEPELDPEHAPSEVDSGPPSIPSAASVGSSEAASSTPGGLFSGVLPGHVIANRYEVLGVLGEGGMGIVYRCRDQTTNQGVAIKRVIVPDGKLAAEYVMWFYKEARALAALDHPSIVRARDFGRLMDGSPYLAMDLATGVSLHDLAQTRLSFPLIWSIVDQILSALAHAHARGIVHGDLKPSNVLVEAVEKHAPLIHILDFGLAWLKQDPHDERLDGAKAMEFAPHAGAGTPGYMAPEQIQHEMHHVCGATDLYSLGCILYKLLSGRAPFTGDAKELLRLHAFDPPPVCEPTIRAPEGVPEFVMRLLAKRPWDRWEFAAGAGAAWGQFHPTAEVDPRLWRFPNVTAAIPPAPTTRRTGRHGPTPDLSAAPERAPGLLSIRPSPLVGRDDVRHLLRETCEDVIASQGAPHRLVLLVGPAGVGKSRIAEWLCEIVHEEGTMVPLRARYRPIRSPLDGMLGAVTQYLNFERSDRETIERSLLSRWKVARDDKTGRTWVAGAAEWLRPLGPMGDHPVGPSGIRFTLDTLETRRMVTRYTLRRISKMRPLLFWLDDLHHAGEATFEGLLKIHQNEPDQRIVMVATVRSEDVQLGTPAAERLRNLREKMDGQVIEIRPMDPDTTASLLRASLPLDDASVLEAARRSRGNPLFALQQLHAWALAGNMEFKNGVYRVPPEVLAVRPATTAELWDSRVAALPEEHRLAAFAVAAAGADIRREVLSALLDSLGVPADAAIVSLQNAEIILPRGPGRYSWPHALLQEHLLERLDQRPDRRRVYRAAADALVHHPAANTRRVVRQQVANLLHAAEPDAAGQLLFDFLQYAWNGAREPLATLHDLELLKGHLTGRSLALKHRWQAEALRHVGRTDEAVTHAEIARATFEELNDEENLAHCLRLIGHLGSERGGSAEGLLLVNLAHEIFTGLDNVFGQAQCEAVAGEIEYLLGNYESARSNIENADAHFEALGQPLGRGQCLLLLSWIDHSEGATERARRLTLEARAEFERAGYRLGIAQADASLAHVEHRLMDFYSAEQGALDALAAFETLRTPRGQAACERLLAMVGIDTDDLDMAELHAEHAESTYRQLGDPWGILEATLLSCQVSLARHDLDRALALLERCSQIRVEEAEPRQHYLLTKSWLELESNDPDKAFESLEAAADVFGPRSRVGDHTPHLLGRLSRLPWPPHALGRIDAWRALLNDRARRKQN
ncbi:MAG TPA: protein kinase [Polyangiaceae bacterium]